ncbi:MAG: division/cell wall cluster transcriptional repressor MraZ [Oscillospiraceae bacterium]|nr:division/cell wall cluster transcriptional repressor MraZ [Oscillospiraceae bacterium]
MLFGGFLHNVDIKGRVFIPARFRPVLGARFYVCANHDGCIRGYNEQGWAEFMEKLSRLTIEANQILRKIYGSTTELEMDQQGRVLLPEELRAHAKITDKTKIIGMGGWMEFWNPETADSLKSALSDEEMMSHLASVGIR